MSPPEHRSHLPATLISPTTPRKYTAHPRLPLNSLLPSCPSSFQEVSQEGTGPPQPVGRGARPGEVALPPPPPSRSALGAGSGWTLSSLSLLGTFSSPPLVLQKSCLAPGLGWNKAGGQLRRKFARELPLPPLPSICPQPLPGRLSPEPASLGNKSRKGAGRDQKDRAVAWGQERAFWRTGCSNLRLEVTQAGCEGVRGSTEDGGSG